MPTSDQRGDGAGTDYSVVVPVYGNADTIPALLAALQAVAQGLPGPMEVVLVIDGSPDESFAILTALLPEFALPAQLIEHSRNFGSFAAIRTGLAHARGRFLGVMAADLQEPPELMADFFAALSTGEADVVVGRREGRADPAVSRTLSRTFWWAYRRLVNEELPRGGVDVFGCTAAVRDRLVALTEANSSLVGLLYWVGYRRVEVPYERHARPSGRSGWTMSKRVRYLLDSVYTFTDIPIQLLTAVGVVGSLTTLATSLVVFVAWATGRIPEPGYTPLMLTILLSTFVLLAGLGVVGSYVWRTFENSKGRPTAIVRSARQFPDPPAGAL